MKVKGENSRLVKPCYINGGIPPPTTLVVPLSVFDSVTYNTHVAIVYVYHPPTPPNSQLEKGLATALSEYREFAGRLGSAPDAGGKPTAIVLNDSGVRFVEASVDCALDEVMPLWPSPAMLSLHPSLKGPEELAQVQLTRFACGSLVVGFTSHHMVADGHATGNLLVAWGKATRGLAVDPLPLCRAAPGFFAPRDPRKVEFEHRGAEFTSKNKKPGHLPVGTEEGEDVREFDGSSAPGEKDDDVVVVHRAHFPVDFLAQLKARAASGAGGAKAAAGSSSPGITAVRPYNTFQCLVAHLWRVATRARELEAHETITQVRIAVDGRARLRPPVPEQFFGNLVLWAFPRTTAAELLAQPLGHAAGLVRDAVARTDDAYFRSFVDYASSAAVEAEGLVPTAADEGEAPLSPNLEVHCWLGLPFPELDFGGGGPSVFMPGYHPLEGEVFLLPSLFGDGGVDAYVGLFSRNLPAFRRLCYSLDA